MYQTSLYLIKTHCHNSDNITKHSLVLLLYPISYKYIWEVINWFELSEIKLKEIHFILQNITDLSNNSVIQLTHFFRKKCLLNSHLRNKTQYHYN